MAVVVMVLGEGRGLLSAASKVAWVRGGDEETAVTPRQDRGCLRDLECVLPSGMMSFVIRCGHILCVDIHMLFFSHSVRYWC